MRYKFVPDVLSYGVGDRGIYDQPTLTGRSVEENPRRGDGVPVTCAFDRKRGPLICGREQTRVLYVMKGFNSIVGGAIKIKVEAPVDVMAMIDCAYWERPG